MRRRIVPVAAIGVLLAVIPATASAGKPKLVVFKETTGECQKGLLSGVPTKSTARITVTEGTVTAKVSLKKAEPNATYQVDLVETPSGTGCLQFPGQAEVTTNSKGKGKVTLSEPVAAGETGVFVMLLSPGLEGILATETLAIGAVSKA
jgi:hypothetical protein